VIFHFNNTFLSVTVGHLGRRASHLLDVVVLLGTVVLVSTGTGGLPVVLARV